MAKPKNKVRSEALMLYLTPVELKAFERARRKATQPGSVLTKSTFGANMLMAAINES